MKIKYHYLVININEEKLLNFLEVIDLIDNGACVSDRV